MGIKYKLVTLILVTLFGVSFSFSSAARATDTLLAEVVSLKLGLNGYVIGEQLDAARKKIADTHLVEGAYEGTYKFVDNELYVVVDSKTDRILALYKQKKDADKEQLKTMVAELMDRYGAPTTMAHEKILYWAFNKHGAVSEEDFNQAKKIKQTKGLGIVATVKLNSDMEITPDPKENKKHVEKEKSPATGTMYFIITSDPLVKEFMVAQPQ